MLAVSQATGVPMEEQFLRYLDGDGELEKRFGEVEDGAMKRALDEFKEKFGWKKRVNWHHSVDDQGDDAAVEEGQKDEEVEGKGKEKATDEKKSRKKRKRMQGPKLREN